MLLLQMHLKPFSWLHIDVSLTDSLRSVKDTFLQTMPYLVLDVLENFSYSL